MAVANVTVHAGRRTVADLSGPKRWIITIAATAVSTYALDAVATATGVGLVASQLLRGLDHWAMLMFLAGTYVIWGGGLRVALAANWALLEKTGTSSNALSKATYDLAKSRTLSLRARRIASALGYIGTELAKETPYYAGAAGAALLSDSVSATDALIFLGGANLGAAAYEYGLGRAIGGLLKRSSGPVYASFETDWVPGDYLRDYYSLVEPDECRTIAFFVDAMRSSEPDEPILFFGVGPALHHVFLAAAKASELHLGDYLPANLREIERWIARDPEAHDWRPFVRYTLACEGLAAPTEEEVTRREELTRARITRLLEVDLRRDEPLGDPTAGPYATVISAYLRGFRDRRSRHLGDLHEAHHLPGASRGHAHGGRPAPLSRLSHRGQDVPKRECRRERPRRSSCTLVPAGRRDDRGLRADRGRIEGLLEDRSRAGSPPAPGHDGDLLPGRR